jgi:hypothetical protein
VPACVNRNGRSRNIDVVIEMPENDAANDENTPMSRDSSCL